MVSDVYGLVILVVEFSDGIGSDIFNFKVVKRVMQIKSSAIHLITWNVNAFVKEPCK